MTAAYTAKLLAELDAANKAITRATDLTLGQDPDVGEELIALGYKLDRLIDRIVREAGN